MRLKDLVEHNTVVNLSTLTSDKELVTDLQTRLSAIGFLTGDPSTAIDGVFGAVTKDALDRFCKAVHLNNSSTGVFGATFARKLIDTRPPVMPVTPTLVAKPQPTSDALATALKFTLLWEGGYVNHPDDPGGATNKGVTQDTYNTYRINNRLSTRRVDLITDAEVHDIYLSMYWKPSQANIMVLPLAIAHFDTAVNFGVGGAIEFLQEALEISADGIFGPGTQAALLANNNAQTAQKIVRGRIYYRNQRVNSNPTQEVFLTGWLNRDNDLGGFLQSRDVSIA
ncbi:MAG: peptidoglycan-binding protein [Candidatus Parcubacteria bacterium]|nr:peptidoglycan-binding protein [Leptolyngbyaceae cyanobacterium LF-bin-113]